MTNANYPRRPEKSRRKAVAAFALLLSTASLPARAVEEAAPPKGAAVTVLKAEKACFSAIVEVSGIIIPKDEVSIRPDRPGSKVDDVLVEPGQTITAGQVMARLILPDGNVTQLTAPVSGLVSTSTAVIGAIASAKGEALFTIITRSEFDLVGQVPTESLAKLKPDQPAKIRVVGAGELDGKVRRVAATVEPNVQLGQVFVAVTSPTHLLVNSAGRALIQTGTSCGISVPLTAILYSSAGTVVQVVRRDRVETRRVEVGLMSAGRVEVREGLNEGDIVVARAGALLREGDAVRPITASATAESH